MEVSMNNITTTIWGREFVLDIVFDLNDNEERKEAQTKALDSFIENIGTIDNCLSKVKE